MTFEDEVRKHGVNSIASWTSKEVMKRIDSYDIALQFVLEELDAARQGDDTAINFANNSGFKENEYVGAMGNSFEEVDGPDGPQNCLLNIVLQISDIDLMVRLRVATVDKIMLYWNLGKYREQSTFNGFILESECEKIAKYLDLSESGIHSFLDKYNDVLIPMLMGRVSPKDVTRMNELADFMGYASSTGHPIAVALSCFTSHGGPFTNKLPVPINRMDKDTIEFLVTLYESNIGRGYSQSGRNYLQKNSDKILEMANAGNESMMFLLGIKGARDGEPRAIYRKWYERSALAGFELAYYHTAGCFDGDESTTDKDYSKAAYWNYQGAKIENRNGLKCCYNLGIMYAMGDFVEKNTKTASFYLSLAYRNAHRTEFPELKNDAINAMKEHSIEMQQPPYFLGDREMDPELAELSNIY